MYQDVYLAPNEVFITFSRKTFFNFELVLSSAKTLVSFLVTCREKPSRWTEVTFKILCLAWSLKKFKSVVILECKKINIHKDGISPRTALPGLDSDKSLAAAKVQLRLEKPRLLLCLWKQVTLFMLYHCRHSVMSGHYSRTTSYYPALTF